MSTNIQQPSIPQSHPISQHCSQPPKWAALVDDEVIPMPNQRVKASVIRTQASVPESHVLVRDHNSPNDVVIDDDAEVDLSAGNVFYTLPRCDAQPRHGCTEPAKLAFFVDD